MITRKLSEQIFERFNVFLLCYKNNKFYFDKYLLVKEKFQWKYCALTSTTIEIKQVWDYCKINERAPAGLFSHKKKIFFEIVLYLKGFENF